MKFLASAPLYSSVLPFAFFHVVSAIESNIGSKYPALNSLLIISPNTQLSTVHLHWCCTIVSNSIGWVLNLAFPQLTLPPNTFIFHSSIWKKFLNNILSCFYQLIFEALLLKSLRSAFWFYLHFHIITHAWILLLDPVSIFFPSSRLVYAFAKLITMKRCFEQITLCRQL